MKNDVLDVLLYIFERFEHDDYFIIEEAQKLADELSEVGFTDGEIDCAFDWIDTLAELREKQSLDSAPISESDGFRFYTAREERVLGVEGIALLRQMEQCKMIDFAARELVIDRVLALSIEPMQFDQVQWIIMMVLSNLEGYEEACAWFEAQGTAVH